MKSSANRFAYAIALSAVLTNGTREFFGSKLEKALQGIETGQLIQ